MGGLVQCLLCVGCRVGNEAENVRQFPGDVGRHKKDRLLDDECISQNLDYSYLGAYGNE